MFSIDGSWDQRLYRVRPEQVEAICDPYRSDRMHPTWRNHDRRHNAAVAGPGANRGDQRDG